MWFGEWRKERDAGEFLQTCRDLVIGLSIFLVLVLTLGVPLVLVLR